MDLAVISKMKYFTPGAVRKRIGRGKVNCYEAEQKFKMFPDSIRLGLNLTRKIVSLSLNYCK